MATPVKASGTAKATPRQKAASNGEARVGPVVGLKAVNTSVLQEDGSLPPEHEGRAGVGLAAILDTLRELQEHPNEWFEIVQYSARPGTEDKPGGARKTCARFLNGQYVAPEGPGEYDLDWRSANYDGSGRKGSVLLGMYATDTE